MGERPMYLPDFRDPPLAEVAIAVVVSPLHGLTSAHRGLYWQTIRGDFPHVAEQPGMDPTYETDDGPLVPAFSFRLGSPSIRTQFTSADDESMIQVQPDVFVHNWRRGTAGTYPRFDQLASDFLARWAAYRVFLKQEQVGQPAVEQVEVTYVNIIDEASMLSDLSFTPSVDTTLDGAPADTAGVLEDHQVALRYRVAGHPAARLYATATPRGAGWMLELTFRSRQTHEADLGAALQRARTAIDGAFVALTSTTARQRWGMIVS